MRRRQPCGARGGYAALVNDSQTLKQLDPALYDEVMRGLASYDFSPAADMPPPALADAFAAFIARAPIATRCACGQPECHSYRYDVPDRHGCNPVVVRMYARGELLVRGNDAGEVYAVERLYDVADRSGPRLRIIFHRDGRTERRAE